MILIFVNDLLKIYFKRGAYVAGKYDDVMTTAGSSSSRMTLAGDSQGLLQVFVLNESNGF